MSAVLDNTHRVPPSDNDIIITAPSSSQNRKVQDLTDRMEDHRKTLKSAWFWQLNTYEVNTIRKLKETLQAIFDLAIRDQIIEREYLFTYLESMIALKLTFDEKESRTGNCLTRRFRAVFGNRVVSTMAYVTGGVGITVSGIAFGLSQYYGSGPALIACTALGIITGVVGGSSGLSATALKRYSEAIRVTGQSKRIQNSFKGFFNCYLNQDYEGCKRSITQLSVRDKALLTNEVHLLYLINHLSSHRGMGETVQAGLHAKSMDIYDSSSEELLSDSLNSAHARLHIEEESESDESLVLQAPELTNDDLIALLHQYLPELGHEAEGTSDATSAQSAQESESDPTDIV